MAQARRYPKFTPSQVLSLAELDELLDIPVARFDRRVEGLVKRFKEQQVRVEVPETRHLGAAQRVVSTRQYEAELSRLPQMERAEEFRMARRHEFMRRRVVALLKASGLGKRAEELVGTAFSELPPLPKPDWAGYLAVSIAELSRLRKLYVEGALHLSLISAFRYRGMGVDLPDLIQEGNASLFQAIDGFDWRRDVRFRTYAQYWVHQAVLKALYNSSRTVRIPVWVQKALRKAQRLRDAAESAGQPRSEAEIAAELGMPEERLEGLRRLRRRSVSLDVPVGEDGGTTLSSLIPDHREDEPQIDEGIDLHEHLGAGLGELPARQRMILRRRFGLGGVEPETLAEIAADLGVSAERVRQLQNAAIEKLRTQAGMQRLAELV